MTRFEVDAIYFGDDRGQQHGLIMGPELWHEFIFPELKRMYGAVKERGKKVFIHSRGDVDELFDFLIEIGLDCFNPFQPEVMDIHRLMRQYFAPAHAVEGDVPLENMLASLEVLKSQPGYR